MIFERPSPHFGASGHSLPGEPMGECAQCGSDEMRSVTSAVGTVNYLCDACGRCWSMDGTGVHRVDPVLCAGCPDRPGCFERLRQDIPVWGWWVDDA